MLDVFIFSNRLGVDPKVLPTVTIKQKNSADYPAEITLIRFI